MSPARLRVKVTVAASIMMIGCGSSPASPSGGSSALPFRAGVHGVTFNGPDFYAIGSGPILPGCPNSSTIGLQFVSTYVDLTFESGAWHARPQTSDGGAFELVFSPGPTGVGAPGGGPGVKATATGTVISTFSIDPTQLVRDSRVVFSASATLTGGVSRDGTIASGQIAGAVSFANSAGVSTACNSGSVSWSMSGSPF